MKEYTIKQAAEALDVSTSTVRRRIKEGEIEAYKKDTDYGPTYFIPINQIDRAIMEKDVVEVKQPVDVEEMRQTLLEAFNRQNKQLYSEMMDSISEEIKSSNKAVIDLKNEIRGLSKVVKELKEETLVDKVKKWFK